MKRISIYLSTSFRRIGLIVCLIAMIPVAGCKKFLDLPLPVDQVAGAGAYSNDYAVSAVLNSILGEVANGSPLSGNTGFPARSGLYTDELQNASTLAEYVAFYTNAVQSAHTGNVWSYLYFQLYAINLAVEGIQGAAPGVLIKKDQWLGEALFLRALMHFYLVNLFGDVPIAITSDFKTNNAATRSPRAAVYQQIVKDLTAARNLLSIEYRDADGNVTADRARPNRNATVAFLARVYLYREQWADAETQASLLISNTATYQLVPPAQVFLSTSKEAILGFAPPAPGNIVRDATAYIITAGKTPAQTGVAFNLSATLVSAFEPGDTRFTNWVGVSNVPASGTTPARDYYFANKYKVKTNTTTATEYQMLFRLGEQYLIRAEARARLNNITGAKADVDAIRIRAGLAGTTAATPAAMVDSVLKERRVELFTESGNRFFDLRRTGKLDAVMTDVAPQKGGAWSSYKQWWPILTNDTYVNPNLTQTPGYQ
jgi:hypothetical protein